MIEALRANAGALGNAYHELFMGRDTDEAEAAAWHFGQFVELQIKHLGGK